MNKHSNHEFYMRRCLELASLGLGRTAPNPMVGAVVVSNDKIIGEGYHQMFGSPHAEVNAIKAVKDKSLLKSAVLYVNLEPCAHVGKTPPCADLIIENGIPEVIIGTIDPNPLVKFNGIKKLESAGVKVKTDVLSEKCRMLNKRFFTYHNMHRPYVILKWAQTSDGFMDILRENSGNIGPTWISNDISRALVHKWRSEEQAIIVGTNTALMDNPKLTVRNWPGRSPIRVVVDKTLKLPKHLHIFDNSVNTLILNDNVDNADGNTRYLKFNFKNDFINNLLSYLYKEGIQSIIIEGGRKFIDSFITENLWDEARVFIGHKQFGAGVKAPFIKDIVPDDYAILNDRLLIFNNEN